MHSACAAVLHSRAATASAAGPPARTRSAAAQPHHGHHHHCHHRQQQRCLYHALHLLPRHVLLTLLMACWPPWQLQWQQPGESIQVVQGRVVDTNLKTWSDGEGEGDIPASLRTICVSCSLAVPWAVLRQAAAFCSRDDHPFFVQAPGRSRPASTLGRVPLSSTQLTEQQHSLTACTGCS